MQVGNCRKPNEELATAFEESKENQPVETKEEPIQFSHRPTSKKAHKLGLTKQR
jgi:hypothetical protein